MAGITLATAEAKLTLWLAADDAIATGQSYSIEGRTLTRANADVIQKNIIFWNAQVQQLSTGGFKCRAITPVINP